MPKYTLPRLPVFKALLLCALNWLIPGAGYWACGDRHRGAALFFSITGCFAIGLWFGGYVLVPAFRWSDPEFNIVAILTYVTQSFFGSGWLFMLATHHAAAATPGAFFNLNRLAGANPWSDIGVLHFVVAGGLNYVATVRLYDLLAGSPELTETTMERKATP